MYTPVDERDPNSILPSSVVNQMIDNDESFHDGSGIDDDAISRAKLDPTTRKMMMGLVKQSVSSDGATFPAASDQHVVYSAIIPDDYVSGDVTIKISISSAGTTGVYSMYRTVAIIRPAVATNFVDTNVFSTPSVTTGSFVLTFTVDEADVQAGDIVYFDIHRDGPGGSDTSSDSGNSNGAWIEYLGRA